MVAMADALRRRFVLAGHDAGVSTSATMKGRAPSPSRTHPPPWLFALTELPFGIGCGFVASTMPYLTRQAGVSVSQIGWYGTVFSLATVLRLLYAPLLDGVMR